MPPFLAVIGKAIARHDSSQLLPVAAGMSANSWMFGVARHVKAVKGGAHINAAIKCPLVLGSGAIASLLLLIVCSLLEA